MAGKRIERTGAFDAIGTDGRTYQVIEYTEFHDASTVHGAQNNWVPGIKSYRLRYGDPVNALPDGDFEIARTGLRLRR
jgi:hypothetical protein